MSTNLRLVVAVLGAMALAALATPDLSSKLPPGTTQILAAVIAAVLHKLNDKAPPPPPADPSAQ